MKTLANTLYYAIVLMVSLALLVSCSTDANGGETNDSSPDATIEDVDDDDSDDIGDIEESGQQEPVTLTFMYGWGEGAFIEHYKEPVEEALPHITLEWIEGEISDRGRLEELITAGQIPDIMLDSGPGHINNLKDFEIEMPLDELFEQNNFDLNRVDPNIIQEIRNAGDGRIHSIPILRRAHNIYYNKDIFDMFGVNYPTDRMTWDETIDLARQVTGESEGMIYRGFDISMPSIMLDQREVTHVDPDTHEVLYDTEPTYQHYLQKLENLWSIPGMLPEDEPGQYLYSWGNNFLGADLNVAMGINWDAFEWTLNVEESAGLNWDIVTYPVWEDQPNRGASAGSFMLFGSGVSEHPDAIYDVFEYILSDEYQEWSSRHLGRPTVLNDPAIQQTLASEMDGMQGRNLDSIFMLEPNPGLPPEKLSPYRRYDAMWDGVVEFAELNTDVNTFLRQMQEETEEMIRQAIASGDIEAMGVWK